MTKRLVDLDDTLLDEARAALGTAGVSDTVRAALRAAADAPARAAEAAWLVDGGMAGLAEPESRDTVWR